MKKLLLFMGFMWIAYTVQSQSIVYHENFELPTAGDSVVSSGNPSWGISTHLQHLGMRSDTNKVAVNDSSFLTTSAFSTLGNYYVILEFSHICKIEFFDNAIIQVSNNNGVTWTQLTSSQYLGAGQFAANGNKFTSTSYADWVPATPSAVPTNSWWKTEQFDISSLVSNASQVKVRFKLSDGNATGAAGNYGWLIDDIKVTMNLSELIPPVITLLAPNYSGTVYSLGPYAVNALITDVSGIDTAKVFYSINNGAFNTVGMNMVGADTFQGFIPAVNDLDTVCYYVYAEDASPNHNSAQAPSTGCRSFIASSGITFPYFDNFDISYNWTDTTSSLGSKWELGTPTFGVTNSVHSSPNAWDVNLSAAYGSSANCMLLTPVFDFSSAVNAKMSFWINYNTETNYDGTRLEYTLDGSTWQVLGTVSDPNGVNWYTNTIYSSGNLPAWAGNSNGWIKAEYTLTLLNNVVGPVQFRFIFTSDASVQYDGCSIDDFSIALPAPQDAGVTSVSSPVLPGCISDNSLLSVVVKNFGTQNIVGPFDIVYQVDTNTPIAEQYTGTILPAGTDTMDFVTTVTASAGLHTIKVYTVLPGDGNSYNDTLTSTFNIVIPFSIPYFNPLDSVNDFADICTTTGLYGTVQLIPAAANTGAAGMMMGVTAYTGWTNYSTDTIPTSVNYIWSPTVNSNQFSQARLVVNTSGYQNLVMKFDLKMLYLYNNLYTNFRVVVNGTQITPHLCPNGVSTAYITYEYELSAFLPAITLTIDFESKDYYPYTNSPNGNVIGVDNIWIYEPPAQEAALVSFTSPNNGCGLGQEIVSVKIKNKGSDTISGGLNAKYKITGSMTTVSEAVVSMILPGDTLSFSFATPADLSMTGSDSVFNLVTWVDLMGDTIHSNDTLIKDVASYHIPNLPSVSNATIPYGTSATLTALSVDSIRWYDAPIGGTPISTTPNFTTPLLYDTTIYFVEAVSGSPDVKITEITHYKAGIGATAIYPVWCTGQDLIEISNLGSAPINLKNYTMNIYGVGASTFTIPDFELGAGEVMVLHAGPGTDDAANHYFNMGGISDVIQSSSLSGFALKDPAGVVVDAVASNGYIFGTADGVSSSDWNGSINNISSYAGPIRIVSDNNNSSDWIVSSSTMVQTIGSLNPAFIGGTAGGGCSSARVPDTVFVSGIPACDVSVIAVDAPVSAIELGSDEEVIIKVKNWGTSVQSNIPVHFSINGGAAVNEIIAGPLASGDTAIYAFSALADFSAYGNYELKAYTTLACDNTDANDTLSAEIVCSPLEYCTSGAIYAASYEDIGNVTFAGINNGNPLPVTNNTTAINSYSDYTGNTPAYLSVGGLYPISVSIISYSSFYDTYVKVFIDYNRNGVFDTIGETVFQGEAISAMPTISGVVTIPVTAVTGMPLRMRIVAEEFGDSLSVLPCGTYSYGETEDYFVYVLPLIPHDAGVNEIIQPGVLENEGATIPVEVVIKNYGTDTIFNSDNMQIVYEVNGGAPVTALYNGGPLYPFQSDTVTFVNTTITPGYNTICAYTVLLNDSNTLNDETCKDYYGNPLNDAGVTEILQPPASVASGSMQPVQVVFMNYGVNTITSMNLAYKINNGTPVIQAWSGSIATGEQDTLVLPSFTAPSNAFDVCAYTILNGDGDHTNDTACSSSFGLNKVYLSYCDHFDDSLMVGWYQESLTAGTAWELGTPAYGVTNSANSAPNAWDINLTATYDANAESYLYTQIISFTNVTNAQMSFWQNRNTESGYDGARIDYTIDGGTNWQVLGSATSSNAVNWYTEASISSSSLPGWDGLSSGWIKSEYTLTELNNQPDVQFRFVFTSDGSVSEDGFSIDDFCIIADTFTDVGISKIVLPSGTVTPINPTTVQATIKNYGFTTLTSIPVRYIVNGADSVSETWTGTLVPGDSVDYTFTQPYTPPNMAFYSMCVKTTLSDSIYTNNKKCKSYYTVGLNEFSDNSLFLGQNIPNPANGFTTINYYLPSNGESYFYVMNSIGQKVFAENINASEGKHEMDLDVSTWNPGVYYYVLEFNGDRLFRRMVLTK